MALNQRNKGARSFIGYLERAVWPNVDPLKLGTALPKEEIERILGYGPNGV